MNLTKGPQLFVVTGASCAGKSTMCNILTQNEQEYIVLESDVLWNSVYDTPIDGYREYREVWMRLCRRISQIGMPVVLCGCAIPKQFECCDERKHFADVHYLAVVCDDDVLEERIRVGRGVTDENWVKSSLEFNAWLKENAHRTDPPIQLLDNTALSPGEAAEIADRWICSRILRG